MSDSSNSIALQLQVDLKTAIRSGDKVRRDVIRYTQAALKNEEIRLQRPLYDNEVESQIRKQIKQGQDSIELFRRGGRDDLVQKESSEIVVLQKYLPEELGDEALQKIVRDSADEINASGPADMKNLMPALMERVQGRADGRRLSILASKELKRRAGQNLATS